MKLAVAALTAAGKPETGEEPACPFVFENAWGLTMGRPQAFLEELIAPLEVEGYAIRQSWQAGSHLAGLTEP